MCGRDDEALEEELILELEPGMHVVYDGVVNDESDLERRGVVREVTADGRDVLVEWVLLDKNESRWETRGSLAFRSNGYASPPEPGAFDRGDYVGFSTHNRS